MSKILKYLKSTTKNLLQNTHKPFFSAAIPLKNGGSAMYEVQVCTLAQTPRPVLGEKMLKTCQSCLLFTTSLKLFTNTPYRLGNLKHTSVIFLNLNSMKLFNL